MDYKDQAQQEKELSWGKETVLSHVHLVFNKFGNKDEFS
jgi:hypothetical protein